MTTLYKAGTVTLTAGSALVIGTDTAWAVSLIAGGTIYVQGAGNPMPIATVDGDTQITSALEWTGASGVYEYALMRDTAYGQQTVTNANALAELLNELRQGTLFKYDASGTSAGRSSYDGKAKGFAYLAVDSAPAKLYVKLTDASADWVGPFNYAQGEQGIPGPVAFLVYRGAYSNTTQYARNDGINYNGSSFVALQPTIGHVPPTLPTTANAYWSLLAIKGTDGEMVRATYDPQNKQADAFARINHTGELDMSGQDIKGVLALNEGPLSDFRNKIVNGDGAINQRGAAAVNGYGPDRWIAVQGAGATHSVASASVDWTANGGGNWSALLWARSVAGTAASYFSQRIESVLTNAGKKVTVSFWAASSSNTEVKANLQQNFGSGGSPSSSVNLPSQTLSVTPTPTRYSFTTIVPSIAGKTLGTNANDYLALIFLREYNSPNPTANVNITKISVVVGDATKEADSYAARHPQQELALCQRYFETISGIGVYGYQTAGSTILAPTPFKVTKRVTPTMTIFGWSSSVNANLQAFYTPTPYAASFGVNAVSTGTVGMLGVSAAAESEII